MKAAAESGGSPVSGASHPVGTGASIASISEWLEQSLDAREGQTA